MKRQNKKKQPGKGLEIIDYQELEKICLEKGMLVTELLAKIGFHEHTQKNINNEKPVKRSTRQRICKVLGSEYLQRLKKNRPVAPSQNAEPPKDGPHEWEISKELSGWITASNGLQYKLCLMQHQYLQDTLGRGKCYELGHLSHQERERIRECLLRHPRICRMLASHPQIPVNEKTTEDPSGKKWWVIDKWVPGKTLEQVLGGGPFARSTLPRIMREIAEGLRALHHAKVVRRELSPRNVLLGEPGQSVLLTDFELGKLFDESPTVSNSWPDDPYRAPEVGSQGVNELADLYSWGRILAHAACGVLPARNQEASALAGCDLPPPVKEIAKRCLALLRHKRPKNIEEVLLAIKDWK